MTIFVIAVVEAATPLFSSRHIVSNTFLILWLPFTTYFLMGYFAMKSRVRVSLFATLPVCLLLSAVVAVEAALVRLGWQNADVYMYDLPFNYFNPVIICTSLLIFVGMSKCALRVSERGARRIQSVAAMSLGNLRHPCFMAAGA